ncbi:RND family efflux transporter, MFP subunit [Saccharicrinis carchari]|uniref:RND family efflux transporter, MFP subunit n=1 Tax=Saccharicrinis carchari TaxID=1168039 RepID=A0A521AW89_SACCC|nr:efflux RND transporter periplasmic adaptor subunit [Saccharicrinis carchari]SMO39112.1 RND family efflux transporter, MFP subunit [Saccharicrinis carchari]
MKKNSSFPHSLYTLLLAAIFLSGCGSKDKQEDEQLKPVKYARVEMTGGIQERTFIGVSQSGSEAKLSFRTSGLILAMGVRAGDEVKKGQLIASIDAKDTQIAYEQARAGLDNARIQLQTAASGLERAKQLYATSNASLSDYEQAKGAFSSARSNFQTAQKTLDLQGAQLRYTRIIAPANGIVTAVNAEVNEFVQAGTPVVVISSRIDDIEINVGVPEVYIAQIVQGESVSVTFRSIQNKSFEGIISEVGYSIGESLTYPVVVKLSNPSDDIRPGMPANVTFSFGDKTNKTLLTVPFKAVSEDFQGNFVFVLKAEGDHYVAKKTIVETGALFSGGFHALSGLNEGDVVAVAGVNSLYDGRKVMLLK